MHYYEKAEKSKNNNERASKQRARARKREGKEKKRDILENKHTRLNCFLINNTQIRNIFRKHIYIRNMPAIFLPSRIRNNSSVTACRASATESRPSPRK